MEQVKLMGLHFCLENGGSRSLRKFISYLHFPPNSPVDTATNLTTADQCFTGNKNAVKFSQ
jgi:hypothetical protein